MRVALTGLTIAEYFRDVEGQDVLLFIDNVFRFTQAGSEVSALLGRMPSAVGYQPTLLRNGSIARAYHQLRRALLNLYPKRLLYVPADDYKTLRQPQPLLIWIQLPKTWNVSWYSWYLPSR